MLYRNPSETRALYRNPSETKIIARATRFIIGVMTGRRGRAQKELEQLPPLNPDGQDLKVILQGLAGASAGEQVEGRPTGK